MTKPGILNAHCGCELHTTVGKCHCDRHVVPSSSCEGKGRVLGFYALWLLKGNELGVDRDEHTSRGFKRMLGGSLYRDERRRARDLIKQTPELYRILLGLEIRKQDPDGDSEPECVP